MPVPRFVNRPNPEDMPNQWKLHRVGANGLQSALVLSDDTCGCYVHYWKGRTRPCWTVDCEVCDENIAPRWRGYLAVLVGPSRLTRILELTACCVAPIIRYREDWTTLRGSIITITRKGRKPNGELQCVFAEKPIASANLPSAPDLGPHLNRIWRTTHEPKPTELSLDANTILRKRGIVPSSNGKH